MRNSPIVSGFTSGRLEKVHLPGLIAYNLGRRRGIIPQQSSHFEPIGQSVIQFQDQ
jgi:hypothetical protein